MKHRVSLIVSLSLLATVAAQSTSEEISDWIPISIEPSIPAENTPFTLYAFGEDSDMCWNNSWNQISRDGDTLHWNLERYHQEGPCPLVITDWTTECEMSGLEATRMIRKYQKTLPIVVYSALHQSEYKHLMKKLNCEDFLIKPVHPDLILSTLSKYLDPYTGVKSYYDMFLA